MKKDLDYLMRKSGADAIIAMGSANSDPVLYYLFNGVNVSGWYIKKYRKPAYIIHATMEREEAAKTGLGRIDISQYSPHKIYGKYKDRIKANAVFIRKVLEDLKIKGRIAIYGNMPVSMGYYLLKRLRSLDRDIEILYEAEKNIIAQARMTKDEDEIKRIKKVRNGVVSAFDKTVKWVSQMRAIKGVIYKGRNDRLLIGDLKAYLSEELFRNGLISTSGMILSQARDAGIPHNSGRDNEPVQMGKTIVFDIYPQEIGGGYYFDFTRTVCFGFAPPEIREHYKHVREAQDIAFDMLKIGVLPWRVERAVCEYFERQKHPTFLTNPNTTNGYCHSLGHGLGLNVHESPGFGLLKTNKDRLTKGMVFTIEPGVYYPDKGYGIRLEDVVYMDKNGKPVNLTNYPRNLIVEL